MPHLFRKIQQVSNNTRNEDLEMLSPTIVRRRPTDADHDNEDSQGLVSDGKTDYNAKAKEDHDTLKNLLKPKQIGAKGLTFPVEEKNRFEFLQNPTEWLNNYEEHVKVFTDDNDYLDYILGLLEIIVGSCPYGEDKDDICTPLLLLQKTVTVKSLKKRRDPMRTALKLQYTLKDFAQTENDKNSLYDRKIEELEKIPKQFSVDLMNLCITPSEVSELMRLDDPTMFEDVLKSKNKTLIASKFYQKIVWKTFWGTDAIVNEKAKDGKLIRALYAFKRLATFMFWNLFYLPFSLSKNCDKDHDKRQKRKDQFFSPFSSYLADLVNYTILLLLLLHVTLTTVPNPRETFKQMAQYKAGNITVENNTNFRWKDGNVEILIPTPTVPISEWVLWVCILSRVLSEFYQAYQKKGDGTKDKIKNYLGSVANLCDIVLMMLLLVAMGFKLEMYIHSLCGGIYGIVDEEEFANSSHQTQLVFTIYFYSAAAVFALVHFLHTATIHIPGIGPLLRAIQKMFVDIGHVVLLFVFFVAGFLIPLHGMVKTYRSAHGIPDDAKEGDEFKTLKSISNSLLTLIWGVFGGLSYSEKETLYTSQDTQTTLFMTTLLVTYAIILSLMCMNLLIAMMCNTYSIVTADKSADWRYAQFESIMEYNATTNTGKGMPFLFPLCIPYILYCLASDICCRKKKRMKQKSAEEIKQDNPFAKFLCKFRLDPAKAKARAKANDPVNKEMMKERMAMAMRARMAAR